jgi:hypothetical protein
MGRAHRDGRRRNMRRRRRKRRPGRRGTRLSCDRGSLAGLLREVGVTPSRDLRRLGLTRPGRGLGLSFGLQRRLALPLGALQGLKLGLTLRLGLSGRVALGDRGLGGGVLTRTRG